MSLVGELANRRQELVDERDALEAAHRAITTTFMAPDEALLAFKCTRFIQSTEGGSGGSMMRGQTIVDAIVDRLKEIDRQLRLLPMSVTRRVASVVNVLGADKSTYAP